MFNNLCRSLATAVLLLIALIAIPAFAEDKVTRERIAFAPGTTEATVKAQVQGYDSYEYLVGASVGQTMSVTFATDNTSAYFNIWAPGKQPGQDEAMFIGASLGNAFAQKLAVTGDYIVQVYLYRNAARRNEKSNFSVTVGLLADQGDHWRKDREHAPRPVIVGCCCGSPTVSHCTAQQGLQDEWRTALVQCRKARQFITGWLGCRSIS
jgi:hypothetical protein